MPITFDHITLDTGDGDGQAVLVSRDGRLLAVLSHLGEMHAEIAGQWFVEATFGSPSFQPPHLFAGLDAFTAWVEAEAT